MKVRQIVEKYLKENGFDGLAHFDLECACTLDDLFPCFDFSSDNCESCYQKRDDDGELISALKKEDL